MAWCSIKCRQAYEPSRVTSDLDFSLLHLLRREFPNITSFVKQECSVQNHWKRNYILYEMFKRLFASVGEAKLQCRELFIASGFLHVNNSKSFLKIKRGIKKLRRLRRTGNFLAIESDCVEFRHAFWSLIANGLRDCHLPTAFTWTKKKLCKLTE